MTFELIEAFLENHIRITPLTRNGGRKMTKKIAELYVVANVDDDGNIVSYPKGGGSSSPAYIRAFESLTSAKRSKARMGGAIIKITDAEIVE